MERTLRVCLVGYGFMGKAHSNALARIPMFFPELAPVSRGVLCGVGEAALRKAATQYGWEACSEDVAAVFSRDDIDIVDISASTYAHTELALLAAAHGKHVLCEKPLATNAADARRMMAAVQRAGVCHQVGFNYRFAPAVQLMKQLVEDGRLGRIDHFRGLYLQEWLSDANAPFSWRLTKEQAGSGALGDLGAHVVDLALWLLGDLRAVQAMQKRFVPERPRPEGGIGTVSVDDAFACLLDFSCGAMGTLEVSRNARGHHNGLTVEINGEQGSLRFDFERMNELWFYDAMRDRREVGWTNILTMNEAHPYATRWWPQGHAIGYEHTLVHAYAAFLHSIRRGDGCAPDFADGVRNAQVLDAIARAAETGAPQQVDSF